MTPPVKPYTILALESGRADVYDRESGDLLGELRLDPFTSRWVCRPKPPPPLVAPTRTEAAALVYQAWLDRTSEEVSP